PPASSTSTDRSHAGAAVSPDLPWVDERNAGGFESGLIARRHGEAVGGRDGRYVTVRRREAPARVASGDGQVCVAPGGRGVEGENPAGEQTDEPLDRNVAIDNLTVLNGILVERCTSHP